MSLTFLQLKEKLRREIWPGGEAKNLRLAHDAYFVSVLIDLQRWIDCLKVNNITQYAACSSYWECYKTVVEAPKGIVQRVYTIANDDWCDKVHYWHGTFNEVECWASNILNAVAPTNAGLQALNQGYKYSETTSDVDVNGDAWGRARTGIFAIHRKRIYLAPWIQSNEKIIVEWDGMKSAWADTDILDEKYWIASHEEAIKLYVKSQHEIFSGDKREGLTLKQLYDDKRADLMYDCNEETRQRQEQACMEGAASVTQEQLDDDVIEADEEAEYVTALIGDWGVDGTPLDDVIEQIEDINPRKVITLGDNVYGASQLFGKFGDLTVKPAWGNHDHDFGLQALLDLFTLSNNERYYTVVDGPIHFFILDTDSREADGGYVDATTSTQNSIMGEWLRVQLALSTAKWKVVIGHHSPYSSDSTHTPGSQWMRWPFKTWGADLFIGGHGHNYEYSVVDGFPYIVNGLGGATIRGFGALTTGSQFRYNADYGFLKSVVTCDSLSIKMISRAGTEIHEVLLEK